MILGVDPGAAHVGVSVWDGQVCQWAKEVSPRLFAESVVEGWVFTGITQVIAEDYVSQGGFGSSRTGADTSELLGLLYWTATLGHGLPFIRVNRLNRDAALQRMKAWNYAFRGTKSNHARDAEAVVLAGTGWSVRVLEKKPDKSR